MMTVLAPLFTMLFIGSAFFAIVQSRARHAAISLGTIFAAVVLLYASYPLLMYWGLDGFYTPLNDSRLFTDQPPPSDVAYIAWLFCIYLASFCVGYLVKRHRREPEGPLSIENLDASTTWSLFAIFILLRVTLIGAEMLFAEHTSSYAESYLKYKHLPLLAQQLLGHANGIAMVLSIIAIAFLARRWDKNRLIVMGWILLELVLLVAALGARTQFVMLCLSALFSYHFLYRPISASKMIVAGVALVVAFLALGILRQYATMGVSAVGGEALASNSEFEVSFANAYEINRLVTFGEIDRASMVGAVYLGDILNLVPQQIMPFEKVSLATWYMDTFHAESAESGVGLAFGAVPEALMGAGWPDLIWRGALVGFLFRWFDDAIRHRTGSLWRFALYLWLMVSCYQIFRLTTLAVVPLFVYRFLPAMALVSILAYLLREAGQPQAAPPGDRQTI
jgi:oligosaccharide repeat unit polymerase